jgi:hypothetical protein
MRDVDVSQANKDSSRVLPDAMCFRLVASIYIIGSGGIKNA